MPEFSHERRPSVRLKINREGAKSAKMQIGKLTAESAVSFPI